MNTSDTAATVLDSIGLVNATDVCDCHDAGVLPVDVETSELRFHARLTDGFIILGWTTEGADND